MVSLKDISDEPTGTVEIRGHQVPLVGLSMRYFMRLIGQFDDLKPILEGAAEESNFSVLTLIRVVPDAAAKVAAAGTGEEGDKEAEERFQRLSTKEQVKILKAVFQESFGDELNPLFERVRQFIEARAGGSEPATPAPGAAPGTTGRRPSRESLRSSTTPEMFGATHPGNSPATPS